MSLHHYLRLGDDGETCSGLFVHVCDNYEDYAKTTQPIFTELVGGLEHEPRKNPLEFRADPSNITTKL